MKSLIAARLSPFRHANYRRFFFVQTMSLTGSFAHDLARSWVILETMKSATALGTLQTMIAIPCLLFVLYGGVLVDRIDVKRIMIITKFLLGISALCIGALLQFSTVPFWLWLAFGLLEGFILAFDAPAFSALTVRMIPKQEFQQAIALNSINFHASRMLGPVIAGFLISFSGPGSVMFFDGITYLMIVGVIMSMTLSVFEPPKERLSGWTGIRDGLRYVFTHPKIRYRMLQLMLTICLLYPLMISVFRAFIQHKFNLDAQEFGFVFMAPAVGSMMGAMSFAVWKPADPTRALWVGIPFSILATLTIPFFGSAWSTSIAMGFTGFFLYLSFASLTVSMQLDVDNNYRGRMSSLIQLGFSSLGPLMCFPAGYMADHWGMTQTITLLAGLFAVLSPLLYWLNHRNSATKVA